MWVAASGSGSNAACSSEHYVEQMHQIFTATENQIADLQHKEFYGMHGKLSWDDRGVCFPDSVLCFGGKCPQHFESARIWEEDRICHFVSTPDYRDLDYFDGEPFVLEWKIFPGHTTT